jgi:DNA-binding transcriptional LysR family regulator
MRESSGLLKGRVRLVTPFSFGRVTVIPALPLFYERYPDLILEIEFSDRPIELIQEGFDLGVRTGDLTDSRLIRRVLLKGPMVTVASPAFIAKHGAPSRPEDLVNYNCIVGSKFGPEWSFGRGDEQISMRVKGNLWLESGDAVREAASVGLGIAHSTWWLFRKDIEAGRVVPLLDDYEREGIPVSVVYPANRHLARKVVAVIDFLREITRNEKSNVTPA